MWWRSEFEAIPFPYMPPSFRAPKVQNSGTSRTNLLVNFNFVSIVPTWVCESCFALKECIKLFLIRLPMSRQFIVPRNMKLLAVPLSQIHGNAQVCRILRHGRKVLYIVQRQTSSVTFKWSPSAGLRSNYIWHSESTVQVLLQRHQWLKCGNQNFEGLVDTHAYLANLVVIQQYSIPMEACIDWEVAHPLCLYNVFPLLWLIYWDVMYVFLATCVWPWEDVRFSSGQYLM